MENWQGPYQIISNLNKNSNFYITGDLGFNQSLLVFSHDNRAPLLIMILCGGNTRANDWRFNYTILHIDKTEISISGGNYNNPLVISMLGKADGFLSITPLGGHRTKLSVELRRIN